MTVFLQLITDQKSYTVDEASFVLQHTFVEYLQLRLIDCVKMFCLIKPQVHFCHPCYLLCKRNTGSPHPEVFVPRASALESGYVTQAPHHFVSFDSSQF